MHELPFRKALKLIAPILVLGLVVLLPGVAAAKKPPKKHHPPKKPKPAVVGTMYAETNDGAANQLVAFDRYSNGRLKLRQTVDTGGKGGLQPEPGCDPPGGCPLLDSQGEVATTNDGKLVFAVNAGSNTISSFTAGKKSVALADQVASGGVFPNSLTIHGDLLYVLNTNSKNIAGFRFSAAGKLTPIPGSSQALTAEAAPLSRQIGFDRDGNFLVVTLLTNAAFDTFKVTNGVAGPATAHPSASPEPFAFSFDQQNNMYAAEIVNDQNFTQASNASSYSLTSSGGLTTIASVSTQGYAACWTEITKNGKWLFVVNTGGPSPFGATVTTFALAPSGQLTFKGVTPKANSFTLTDEALSRDDKYLYVVAPLINNPFASPPPATNGSKIIEFKVGADGSLTKIGETTERLAPGLSGLDGN